MRSCPYCNPALLRGTVLHDDESDDDAMECFVSAIVDDHVPAMMSSGIGVALGKSELQLKLRVAFWDIARQLRIALLPDRTQ